MAESAERLEREEFDAWWQEHGQFMRAGGGQYEVTFAYEAWMARARRVSAEAGAPVGWRLVPVEPTPEMQQGAALAIRFDTTLINKLWTGNAVYRAMLTAAPIMIFDSPPCAGVATSINKKDRA